MEENALVYFSGKKLNLDTGFSQSAWSRNRDAEKLGEEGFLAQKDGDVWKFSSWSWSETDVCGENSVLTVILRGDAFEGNTLSSLLEDKDERKKEEAVKAVLSACEYGIKEKIKLEVNGSGGIWISEDCKTILFLPHNFYKNAVLARNQKISSVNYGFYVHPLLEGEQSIRFMEAVLIYRLLTKVFPFSETSLEKRNEDILDGKYIRLEEKLPWLEKNTLSLFVRESLEDNPEKINKRRHKALLLGEREFDTEKKCPLEELDKILKTPQEENKAEISLIKKRQALEIKKREKKIQRKRWIRHHKGGISAFAIAFLFALGILVSVINSQLNKYTSKGMTAKESLQAFYSAVNYMNIDQAQVLASGKQAKEYYKILTQLYVVARTRSGNDSREVTLSPSLWIIANREEHGYIHGLTQFKIDGEHERLDLTCPKRKEGKKSVSEEDGLPLTKEQKKNFRVSYYLVFNKDNEELNFFKCSDNVEMIFKGGKWLVGEIEQTAEEGECSYLQFIEDYREARKEEENSIKIGLALSKKYSWIPESEEIIEAAQKLEKDNYKVF